MQIQSGKTKANKSLKNWFGEGLGLQLGGVWASLGRSWGHLGRSLSVQNGAFYKHLTKIGSKKPFGSILDRLWRASRRVWREFGRVWRGFWSILECILRKSSGQRGRTAAKKKVARTRRGCQLTCELLSPLLKL